METEKVIIQLDEKEFIRLMQLLFLGNYVVNSNRDEGHKIKEYQALDEKLTLWNTKFIIWYQAKKRSLTNLPIYGIIRSMPWTNIKGFRKRRISRAVGESDNVVKLSDPAER